MTHVTHFTPEGDNARLLRDAFGCFATGVTVVTVATSKGPVAITANSFSSVSLDPPLLLWASDRKARRFSYFETADHFAVHILSADQKDLCWQVARDAYCLRDSDLEMNPEGVPLLEGALARFECKRYAAYEGGDHMIFVGQVLRAAMADGGDPLAFFKSQSVGVAP